jgi:hypothetical protein
VSTLEVLLEAERTLMDENEVYDHHNWYSCTCGHIYHAVNGEYSVRAGGGWDEDYQQVLLDVIKVLGLKLGETDSPNGILSDHVEMLALGRNAVYSDDYRKVERKHALKVIRQAITAIRKQDDEAMLKVIDSHTYGIST